MSRLSPKRRNELRAEAHKLNPIVIIGDKGLTDEVIAEIDRSLKAHELIKIRAGTDDRDARDVWMETICTKLEAHPIQQIGKVLVVYREGPKEEKKPPPRPANPKVKSDPGVRRGDKRGALRPPPREEGAKRKRKPSLPPSPSGEGKFTRTARPRSRTPSPLPASGPRRRPRNTSR